MKEIYTYLRHYFYEIDKKAWILITVVVGILVTLNYTQGIEAVIKKYPSAGIRVGGFFFLYSFIFTTSYTIQFLFSKKNFINKTPFFLLLLVCPLLFAAKISLNISDFFSNNSLTDPWIKFWSLILNWPVKCMLMLLAIYGIWWWSEYKQPVAGMNKKFNWKPYAFLLLCAIPIVAVSGMMNDFHNTYPKVKNIAFIYPYTQFDFFTSYCTS